MSGILCAGPGFRQVLTKRSPNMMANWVFASAHSRGGIFHSCTTWGKTRKISFVAASSLGKWPLARTARRSLAFKASIAFVVEMIFRTAGAKAKNGMIGSHCRRQIWPIAADLRPHEPSPKAASALRPA